MTRKQSQPMKLLLQNNPVYVKDCKPPRRIGGGIPYTNFEEVSIGNVKVKIRRNGKSRFIHGIILAVISDDIQKGVNKEWARIINQSDETI